MANHISILTYEPLKQFVKRKLFWYAFPNLVLNSIIPYFNFENPLAVTLFKGEFCFARFILPMALFIPFAITVDCMKKVTAFMGSVEEMTILKDKKLINTRLFLKYGVYNGILTFLVVLLILSALQWLNSSDHLFNGIWLSVLNGLLACSLTIFFTRWSIHKLETVLNR